MLAASDHNQSIQSSKHSEHAHVTLRAHRAMTTAGHGLRTHPRLGIHTAGPGDAKSVHLHHLNRGGSLGLEAGDGGDVSDLLDGLGFTDHDCQLDRNGSTLEEDLLLDHEAKLLVVGVVGKGT